MQAHSSFRQSKWKILYFLLAVKSLLSLVHNPSMERLYKAEALCYLTAAIKLSFGIVRKSIQR